MDFQLPVQMPSQLPSPGASPQLSSPVKARTNAYTDLESLNAIKNEKNEDEALKKVAKQFESLFMHELLKNMRSANSAFEENNLFDNKESNFFRDMYDQQLSVSMSERGMGLSDVLYRQMKSSYGGGPPPGESIKVDSTVKFGTDHAPQVKESNIPGIADKNLYGTAEDFIESVLPMAKKAASALGLDPLMMVAQSALETGWGKHIVKGDRGESSHNLFNIKADSRWDGDKVSVSTVEYRGGIPIKEQAFFRKYESVEESVNDFLDFVKDNPRYQKAVEVASDAKQFIQNLHQSGYATDPQYADKVISVFQQLPSKITSAQKALGGQ